MAISMKNLKNLGGKDGRVANLLMKSPTPANVSRVIKKLPIPKKMLGWLNKAKGAVNKVSGAASAATNLASKSSSTKGGLFGKIAKFALNTATKAALGPVGYAAFSAIDGKFNLSGKLSNAVSGALKKVGSASASKIMSVATGKLPDNVSKIVGIGGGMAGAATLGVKIVQQADPEKRRRPLKKGFAISALAAGMPLAQSVVASSTKNLITGIARASAKRPSLSSFKTAASLAQSPRFFNPKNTSYPLPPEDIAKAKKSVSFVTVSTANSALYSQRGLLQDELMYRLVILGENVYLPTHTHVASPEWAKTVAGIQETVLPLTVLEGFRAEHNLISPHETGEAIDITLGNGNLASSKQCYLLAQWMRDHILYDQLILCFSHLHGGQVWIHVSFKSTARRREVFTKAFDDTHITGLHRYDAYVDVAEKALNEAVSKELSDTATKFMDVIASRQEQLTPPETISKLNSMSPNVTSVDGNLRAASMSCEMCHVVISPHYANSQIIVAAVQTAKQLLVAGGLTFRSAAECGQLLELAQSNDTASLAAYQLELQKYGMVTLSAARLLYESGGYPTVGLRYDISNLTRATWFATQHYYQDYSRVVTRGEIVFPETVGFTYDSLLLSKNGPLVKVLELGGNITAIFDTQACNIKGDWSPNWINPMDGQRNNYLYAAKAAAVTVEPAGCLEAISTFEE